MAAQHNGHCQICGRQHKVTGTKLAKHGYTIRFGWQEGACYGSGGKPYELSRDLLQNAIESAKRYVADTTEKVAALEADVKALADESGAVPAYVTIDHRPALRWVRITQNDTGKIEARDSYDRLYTLHHFEARRAKSVQQALEALRDTRVIWLKSTLGEARMSIEYMQDRFDKWTLQPLQPISAAEQAANAPKVHFQAKKWGYTTTACSHSAMAAQRSGTRIKTTDPEKVTCTACQKELARIAEKAAKAA